MLELDQSEGCPYSEKVWRTASDLGRSYVIHNPRYPGSEGGDVTNEQTHAELMAVGGDDQIPFLVDHDREETLYEADDIVVHLREQYG